ncbi:hypothetical protein [Desulfovibrio aminophilus]|uniref:hypothetical protein n=1 Tax=Desulfovibrio aminophilus TaxID=81425 RepID=UPI003393E0CD
MPAPMFDHIHEFLKKIEKKELARRIDAFLSIDIKSLSDEEIRKLIYDTFSISREDGSNYFILLPESGYYKKGTIFYRVRKSKTHIYPNDEFASVNDFWEPPAEKTKYGRINKDNEPLLYTTPAVPYIAAAETGVRKNDFFYLIVYDAVDDIHVSKIGCDIDYKKYNIKDVSLIEKYELINNFLKDEFSRRVEAGTEYLYKTSEIIAKDFFDLPEIDGWCYPSIKDKTSYNVCFHPCQAKKKMMLRGAIICKCIQELKVDSEICPACILCGFDNDGRPLLHKLGGEIHGKIFSDIIRAVK